MLPAPSPLWMRRGRRMVVKPDPVLAETSESRQVNQSALILRVALAPRGEGRGTPSSAGTDCPIRRTFREFSPYTRGIRHLLVAGGVFAIVAAVCEVAAIGLFGHITDEVLSKQNLGAFWLPAASWLGLAAIAGLVSFVGSYLTALGGERFLLRLRDRVFEHMQTLTPDFFDNRRLGDLMARLTDDIEAIEELIGSGLVKLFTTLVSVIFFAGAAFYIRWDLALLTFVLVPAFLLVAKVFASRFRAVSARERLSNGIMNSVIEEGLSDQSLVQSYNRQGAEAERLHAEATPGCGRTWRRRGSPPCTGPSSRSSRPSA